MFRFHQHLIRYANCIKFNWSWIYHSAHVYLISAVFYALLHFQYKMVLAHKTPQNPHQSWTQALQCNPMLNYLNLCLTELSENFIWLNLGRLQSSIFSSDEEPNFRIQKHTFGFAWCIQLQTFRVSEKRWLFKFSNFGFRLIYKIDIFISSSLSQV